MIGILIHRCNSNSISKIQQKCRIFPFLHKKKKQRVCLYA